MVKLLQTRTRCGASAATLIGNDKSGSVYEWFPFIWPYNAHVVEVDAHTPTKSACVPLRFPPGVSSQISSNAVSGPPQPKVRVADYSLKWISAAKCA